MAETNINLKDAIEKGEFREELYYRLNVVPIKIPPLRERPEDILLLAHHILKEETARLRKGHIILSPEAISALSQHDCPGNVRELQNRIR